jgi:Uma2 family endonuclease
LGAIAITLVNELNMQRGVSLNIGLLTLKRQIVAVLRLESGEYLEVGVFQGEQALISPTFPQLNLTAQQVLEGEL